MMTLNFLDDKGGILLAIVLEPQNLDRLREGKTMALDLTSLLAPMLPVDLKLLLDFTPDVDWLGKEFVSRGIADKSSTEFALLLKESRLRPDVIRPPGNSVEVLLDRHPGNKEGAN